MPSFEPKRKRKGSVERGWVGMDGDGKGKDLTIRRRFDGRD